MADFTGTYLGRDFRYIEHENRWICPDLNVEAPSLMEMKHEVDKVLNKGLKIPVLILTWMGTIERGTLTSFTIKTDDDTEIIARVTIDGRSMVFNNKKVYLDTEANFLILQQIVELDKRTQEAVKEQRATRKMLMEKLSYVSPDI